MLLNLLNIKYLICPIQAQSILKYPCFSKHKNVSYMQVERNLNSHPSTGTRENSYSQETNVKKNQRTKQKT